MFTPNTICAAQAASFNVNSMVEMGPEVLRCDLTDRRGSLAAVRLEQWGVNWPGEGAEANQPIRNSREVFSGSISR